MKKKFLFLLPLAVIVGIALLAFLVILFLTIFEYRPKPVEKVPYSATTEKLVTGKTVSLLSWNIGYAGLGKDEDFFMDGGKKVRPDSKKVVEKYFNGVTDERSFSI